MAETVREYLSKLGKRGGETRAANLTAKQRKDSAKKAAAARWAKAKKEKATQ
jgi:hypothetical protein